MPIQTIEPRRLYRQIADQLAALIRAGEFAMGSRLPAERELALQLGVSRPSVREALIALEVEGWVEVRMGSGVYVVARSAAASAHRLESELGPFELIRARQLVECELAALVASGAPGANALALAPVRSPDRARQRLRDTVERLEDAIATMEDDIARDIMPIRGDRLFHTRIAAASDNGALLRVVSDLFDERNNPLFERMGTHFEGVRSWRLAVAEHRAVVAAIAAGDAAGARAAMYEHLQRSHDRFAETAPTEPAAEPATSPEVSQTLLDEQSRHQASPPGPPVAPARPALSR